MAKKIPITPEFLAEVMADELEEAGMAYTAIDPYWFRQISNGDEMRPEGEELEKVLYKVVHRLLNDCYDED